MPPDACGADDDMAVHLDMGAVKLVEQLGGKVAGVLCLMELAGLNGREKLKGYRVDSALIYEGK